MPIKKTANKTAKKTYPPAGRPPKPSRIAKGVKAKVKHKDTLFRDLFGGKTAALELYNAITGANYGPETEVTMVTLKDVLYDAPVNDVSFTIDNKLVVLVEHQSTINENMPLRMLLYVARDYEQLTEDADKYRRDRMTIQRPEFLVLYNGEEERPEMEILKLSDLFAECDMEHPINLELIVRVYNINKGRNPEIARRSATLNGYEVFTAKVRKYRKTVSLSQAVDRATEECIKEGILVDYLQTHRKAVRNMLTAEWKLEDALKVREMEGEARGEARGRLAGVLEGEARGRLAGVLEGEARGEARGRLAGELEGELKANRKFVNQMRQGGYSVAEIVKVTGFSEKDVKKMLTPNK